MERPSLTAAVRAALLADPDVTERPHRFGGIVFHLGGHELGHIHGETVADLPFPPQIRDELLAGGRASADLSGSDSAWVTRTVSGPHDVAEIVELFQISYEHAASQVALAASSDAPQEAAPDARDQPAGLWRGVLASPSRLFSRRRDRR